MSEENFIDMLQIEGVDYKGFGTISKFIMTDIDLKIGAKALYAYLCSYTGGGSTAYPKRDKILNDLNICKTVYYKYQKQLIDNGYITVKRAKQHPFRNIYTIVSRPPKFKDLPIETDRKSKLIAGGIKSYGYGSIPKSIMLDNRISHQAKALYAYLSSFAGNGNCAFPSTKDILYHLQISINTLTSYMHQLIECNYITVEQRHEQGRFDTNNYYINDMPNEEIGKAEIERRAEYQQKKWNEIRQKNSIHSEKDTASSDELVNLPTSDETPIEDDNSAYTENEESSDKLVHEKKELTEEKLIIEEREGYKDFIKLSIYYNELKNDDELSHYADLIVEIMLDAVLSKEKTLRVNKSDVSQIEVRDQLLKVKFEHIVYVIENMKKAEIVPRNINAYLLTSLYNAVNSMDAQTDLEINAKKYF